MASATIRIRRTNWVFIRNVTDRYTFKAEPVYDAARTNTFLFNDFYGFLYIDYFRVTNLQGTKSDYLRQTGVPTSPSGLQSYGSLQGLMKFLDTDRVDVYFNSTTATSAWSLQLTYIQFVPT